MRIVRSFVLFFSLPHPQRRSGDRLVNRRQKAPEILADEAGLSETPQYRKLHQGMKRCDTGNGIQTGRTHLGMRLCLVRRVGRDGSSPEVILLANPIVAPEWLSYVLQSHFLR